MDQNWKAVDEIDFERYRGKIKIEIDKSNLLLPLEYVYDRSKKLFFQLENMEPIGDRLTTFLEAKSYHYFFGKARSGEKYNFFFLGPRTVKSIYIENES